MEIADEYTANSLSLSLSLSPVFFLELTEHKRRTSQRSELEQKQKFPLMLVYCRARLKRTFQPPCHFSPLFVVHALRAKLENEGAGKSAVSLVFTLDLGITCCKLPGFCAWNDVPRASRIFDPKLQYFYIEF